MSPHALWTAALLTTLALLLDAYAPPRALAAASPGLLINAKVRPPATSPDLTWIDSWATSFTPTTINNSLHAAPTFNNSTLRLFAFSHLAGTQARVKFSNKFESTPLSIGGAHLALRQGATGSAINPGTDRVLSFSQKLAVTIPPGEELWSDPVTLDIPQHADIAVSVFIPDQRRPTGFHETGLKTSYITPGDHTGLAAFPAPARGGARGGGTDAATTTTTVITLISGIQVMAPKSTKVIVTLGDSITDGAASTSDAQAAWPDVLSKRLPKLSDGTPVSVINMGIGSNRFVSSDLAGPAGIKRFPDDVLARPNVAYLIVMEGINDISYEHATPEQLIKAYQQVIDQAHAKGIKVFGATLLPIAHSTKDTPENIATQQAVNKWIRDSKGGAGAGGGGYDAVLDFEKVVQDPQDPTSIRANLTADHVHPNTAGYKLIGDSIDLKLFEN
ncbi:MAG TPA: SGNH/GDSL hydrolase family protein [Phycisphaerae bacterium]|jgi:lysophospholipase L1-like esterase